MFPRSPVVSVVTAVFCALACFWVSTPAAVASDYEDLLLLFAEWRDFQQPRFVDGVPDYSASAMADQYRQLAEYRSRLSGLDTTSWSVGQQVDHMLVAAEMNGLDFDHRVLRPWARDPSFYTMLIESQSDTPAREGPVIAGAIELWRHQWPLSTEDAAALTAKMEAIPGVMTQARSNLVGQARDLWLLGIRSQRSQSNALRALADRLAADHPALAEATSEAAKAVEEFCVWLEQELPGKIDPSGVGVANYDWYLRHVHLVPYSWSSELALMERELDRSLAALALEEQRNRGLDQLAVASSEAEWQRRADQAIDDFVSFLADQEILTLKDYMAPALRERVAPFLPAPQRHFFAQIDMREPLLMRCHHFHWFDLARMEAEPHPSPIRRGPLLYNIWDSRAEGLATGMEEMLTSAGLLRDRPRSRELMYIMIAQRAARAIGALRVHSNEWTVDQAVAFASEWTPRGWLKADGELVWAEQHLYLQQPGYGTSYLSGKAQIETLLAERRKQLGEQFRLRGFLDALNASGMIPVSMIRWEMTGRDEAVVELSRP